MPEISGIKIAKKIIGRLKKQPKTQKILAAILIGKNPASLSFLSQKEKIAKELRIDFKIYKFPSKITTKKLCQKIRKLAKFKKIGGIIVQLPLEKHLDIKQILNSIAAQKDIDVLGKGKEIGLLSPAVGTVKEILKYKKIKPSKTKIAIVGLGFLVGRPIANWLKGKSECRKLYLLDKGKDFKILKNADIVISGVGKAGLIKPRMLKNNAIVIDFGCSFQNGKIKGDFDNSSREIKNIYFTPTPRGTGPILTAKLFENFYNVV
ncbi:hypothetical protein COX75_01665 [bacterium (Candidatus Gribaldobacteria) CG_4_10_14_0_2_um_filter_33_15]|nr:MAG: hypothetical protein COX75_01665 [bacterium (Candidatus Gribaldobacteria) CG_4_10_14_0_2_um_filter_33_15]